MLPCSGQELGAGFTTLLSPGLLSSAPTSASAPPGSFTRPGTRSSTAHGRCSLSPGVSPGSPGGITSTTHPLTPARASGRCLPLQPGAGDGAKAAGAGHILGKLQTPGTSKTCTLHRQPPGPAGAAAAKDRDPSHRGHLGTKQPHPEPGPAPAQPKHPEKGPWPALFMPLRVFSCPGKSARPGQGGFAAERRGGGEVLLLVRCKQAPGAGQPRCPLITSGFVWNKQQPQVRAIISPRCFWGPDLRLQT